MKVNTNLKFYEPQFVFIVQYMYQNIYFWSVLYKKKPQYYYFLFFRVLQKVLGKIVKRVMQDLDRMLPVLQVIQDQALQYLRLVKKLLILTVMIRL